MSKVLNEPLLNNRYEVTEATDGLTRAAPGVDTSFGDAAGRAPGPVGFSDSHQSEIQHQKYSS